MTKKTPITFFDILTINQTTQMLKALIPFLDFDIQKNLAMIIRINEFNQTMAFFNDTKNFCKIRSCIKAPIITLHSSLDNILCNDEIINTIYPYCPENYAQILKNYKNFSKMSDIMNILNENPSFCENINKQTNGFPDLKNIQDIANIAKSLNINITPDMLNNINNIYSQMNVKTNDSIKKGSTTTQQSDTENNNADSTDYDNLSDSDSKDDKQPDKDHGRPNKNTSDNTSYKTNPSTYDFLQNMLSPKQQEIYDSFMNQLDGIDFNGTDNNND